VRVLTDTTGTVTDTYDYDAFGNLIHSTGTTANVYLYSGEQFDPDLHLYYNRARYLNVSTARFLTMDSSEGSDDRPISLHKYLYAGADSVNASDPSGHDFSIGEVVVVAVVITVLVAIPTVRDSIRRTEIEVHFDEIALSEARTMLISW
jgi:RHS repeat-associated protein